MIIFLFSLLVLSSCATGPFVIQETARTVGNGNHELSGGYGNAGYGFKWNYGLSKNFDIGLQIETLSIGVRAKYAFLNAQDNGWSLAAALGTGSSFGGNHYYGDILASYLSGRFEPYGVVRFVQVKTDPHEFKDEETGNIKFKIDSRIYNYGQAALGSRFWATEKLFFSLEASTLLSEGSNVRIEDNLIYTGSLGLRF